MRKKLLSFSAVVSAIYLWATCAIHICPRATPKTTPSGATGKTLLTVLLNALTQLRYLLNLPFAAVSLRGQGKLWKDKANKTRPLPPSLCSFRISQIYVLVSCCVVARTSKCENIRKSCKFGQNRLAKAKFG